MALLDRRKARRIADAHLFSRGGEISDLARERAGADEHHPHFAKVASDRRVNGSIVDGRREKSTGVENAPYAPGGPPKRPGHREMPGSHTWEAQAEDGGIREARVLVN